MPLQIDNLTLLLLALFLAVLLYSRFSRPSPLVHPLLLGKQSEVSAVRKEGETGVYRSFATGQGTPVSRVGLVGATQI
jgi:long-chain acyl-CoA synthetase